MTKVPLEEDQAGFRLVVETGVPDGSSLTLVERKGFGHPDTLADHLAEELSRTYSRPCLPLPPCTD